MTENRKDLFEKFINDNIPDVVEIIPQQADASFRTYSRVITKDTSFMVMNSPIDKEPPFDFIKIGKHLLEQGFNAPKIYNADLENGFLQLQDFGDNTFTKLLGEGAEPKKLYKLAIDTLIELHKSPFITSLAVNPYDVPTLIREAELLSSWYIPYKYDEMTMPQQADLEHAWVAVLGDIPMVRSTLVLRDYHAGNIMLLDNGGCGLLDFQDALIGNPAYDLMSLLEDTRLDIDENMKNEMYEYYKSQMGAGADFDKSYQILSAQRHAKVLGIFVRLSKRDGKDNYLQYLTRTIKMFERSLNSPYLLPVKEFMDKHYNS